MALSTSWPLLLALSTAARASTPDLRLQADPPVNLSSYSTYQWAAASPASDTLLAERARAAIARGFDARGLDGKARGDLAVAVSLDVRLGKRALDFGGVSEGQLAITIYEARSHRVVWRGMAAGPVDPASEADIDRIVNALLAHASR